MELELFETPGAAKRIHVEPCTMEKWRCQRRGPAWIKVGGKVLYRLEDLDEFLKENRIAPGEPPRRRRRKV